MGAKAILFGCHVMPMSPNHHHLRVMSGERLKLYVNTEDLVIVGYVHACSSTYIQQQL